MKMAAKATDIRNEAIMIRASRIKIPTPDPSARQVLYPVVRLNGALSSCDSPESKIWAWS
jgi:hypothetical protein